MMWSDIQYSLALYLFLLCMFYWHKHIHNKNWIFVKQAEADYLIPKSNSTERRERKKDGFEFPTSQTQTRTSWPGLHHLSIDISYSAIVDWRRRITYKKSRKRKLFHHFAVIKQTKLSSRKNHHFILFHVLICLTNRFQPKGPLQSMVVSQSEDAYFHCIYRYKCKWGWFREEVLNNKTVWDKRLPFHWLKGKVGEAE